LENLKKGRVKDFSKFFSDFIKNVCSYYDFADKEPERVYHALVLGMMVQMQSEYRITSNRESGYGRYDIILHPLKKELPAYVFEFKKFDSEDESTIQDTLDAAMEQMKELKYASVLEQEGHENITHIAIAFKGKEVKMRYE
jgi:flavin-binding protein dodecin